MNVNFQVIFSYWNLPILIHFLKTAVTVSALIKQSVLV